LFCAWLTLLPVVGLLPHTSQTLAILKTSWNFRAIIFSILFGPLQLLFPAQFVCWAAIKQELKAPNTLAESLLQRSGGGLCEYHVGV